MQETIRVQIRWPKGLLAELHRLAEQRHSTFSEMVRQACIDQYALEGTPNRTAKME